MNVSQFNFSWVLWLIIFVLLSGVSQATPVDNVKVKLVAKNILIEKTGKQDQFIDPEIISTTIVENKPVYHMINFPEGGWAIVSADDVVHPVIAFSETGSIDLGKPFSPEFQYWMDRVGHEIAVAVKQKATPLQKTDTQWKNLSLDKVSKAPFAQRTYDTVVSPMVTTTWNQGLYYNQMCPVDADGPDGHCRVGCTAVAMAQIMKYYNYPTTGIGSHTYTPYTFGTTYGELTADFGATTYNWTSMLSTLVDYNSEVATILYHTGVSLEMNYSPNRSGANVSFAAVKALKTYFGYSASVHFKYRYSYDSGEWLTLLRNELDNHRPVLYRGSGDQGAHSFICDGYAAGEQGNNDYFHFNWGWGGYLDGYFYLDDLTPDNQNYNSLQGGVFGISPSCPEGSEGQPCDDGDACTTEDTCLDGICAAGPPLDCDDSNSCTSDSCDLINGCVNVCSATSQNDSCCKDETCNVTSVCKDFSWLMFMPAIIGGSN